MSDPIREPIDDDKLPRAIPSSGGALVPRSADAEVRLSPEEELAETEWEWSQLSVSDRSPLRHYLNEIGKTPLLTGDEEQTLARRILQGDEAARDHMIRANLRLVVRIARDYENFGLPLLDLVSEGNLGLVKAIGRFDPERGGKLSTYASWWIRQSIKRALATHGKTIRLPMHMVDRISAMRRVVNALIDELHREPTNEEIAFMMELPVRKIVHLRSVATRAASLDVPVGEGGDATFGDLIGDESQKDPFQMLRAKSIGPEMEHLVGLLDPREAEIIRLRFGIGFDREMTLEEVGEKYKLTRERVRQVQHHAIMKLRRLMADYDRLRSYDDLREEARELARKETISDFVKQKQREEEDREARLRRAITVDDAAGEKLLVKKARRRGKVVSKA